MHGKTSRIHHDNKTVFRDLPQDFVATRYHSLIVEEKSFPGDLEISAKIGGIIMGLRHRTMRVEGVQFHPESVLTDVGMQLLKNFLSILGLVQFQPVGSPPVCKSLPNPQAAGLRYLLLLVRERNQRIEFLARFPESMDRRRAARSRKTAARPEATIAAAALATTMSRRGPASPDNIARMRLAWCAASPPHTASRGARPRPKSSGVTW